ncbi:PAP2 superfamily protein (macronuclear) [Tetrahymena thermophila SB210]|uniref:PAP2 superfamily protein n=1 Tax=Tetrahymena thermophila (strain SB210) TaxID=312017 RepID=I7M8B5_TETTS|nr:PAP2 superfamily protein [Tetrahymena thermophila SB210]EAR97561.2 PAP2 superfamily protein [Tetrahymena thermophila SB210]|eukprot:XP_001017806.2 PAP2 superfamily protein [Tetrahymena thermophila SB210]
MLGFLDRIDKAISELLHKLDSKLVSMILYPFALMFNPSFIIVPICLVYAFNFSILKRSQESSIIQALFYLFCIICNLIMTLVTKKLLKRKRPIFIPWLKNKSSIFRQKEQNCSLPSGDSIQAVNFACNIIFSYNQVNFIMKFFMGISIDYDRLEMILIAFVILVMTARVYFMCHFTFDTILGVIMGYFLTNFLQVRCFDVFSHNAFRVINAIDF